ncbi:hypothetical protein [Streptomyces virginiae]|uniref:hypothetical protein n=1 Tax=Streptomyces virginiae TaxID=1961 RepID=UPI00345D5ACE
MAGWQGGWARGLWRTAVALAAPPLAAALAFGVAWQSAYGSLGDWGFILGGLLLPLLLLGGHAALAARRGASLIALSALPPVSAPSWQSRPWDTARWRTGASRSAAWC